MSMLKVNEALLNLFNAIFIESKNEKAGWIDNLTADSISNGFVISPEAQPYVTQPLFDLIKKVKGFSGEQANSSFHKSWKTVKDTPIEELVIQQIIHYFTTYGLESMGMYDEKYVYVPAEKLEIPELKDNLSVLVIKGITKSEIKDGILNLASGVALGERTLNYILTIVKWDKAFFQEIVPEVKNRELKASLMELYDMVPSDPVEYLRFLMKKITGSSMLIKSKQVIDAVKTTTVDFDGYLEKAPANLASIFFRFKPIFLALKHASEHPSFFNRLRKQANKMHKPMKESPLNAVTKYIRLNALNVDHLALQLARQENVFVKIRLANALNFRLISAGKGICYRVRNGKVWATRETKKYNAEQLSMALEIVKNSIIQQIKPNVEGKNFLIPGWMSYAMPASEKQFIGNIPMGSFVDVGKNNMIIGIHWTNNRGGRVDLDFSLINAFGKIGWDGLYRSEEEKVLFSGDLTDAPKPKGASELFYVSYPTDGSYIATINYYNYSGNGKEVPTRLFIGKSEKALSKIKANYVIDMNDLLLTTNIVMNQAQQVLGLYYNQRFYFSAVTMGKQISSKVSDVNDIVREYFIEYLNSLVSLEEMIVRAGGEVNSANRELETIDLSPPALDKSTILDLLKRKDEHHGQIA